MIFLNNLLVQSYWNQQKTNKTKTLQLKRFAQNTVQSLIFNTLACAVSVLSAFCIVQTLTAAAVAVCVTM